MNQFHHARITWRHIFIFYQPYVFVIFFELMFSCICVCAQSDQDTRIDSELFEQYIVSKYNSDIIVFDASNIKQFWTDKSVLSQNGNIVIVSTPNRKNDPLKIQLNNVSESQDCIIDIITDSTISFSIENSLSTKIAESHQAERFIQHNVFTATIHLEDTQDFSFNFLFSNDSSSDIIIHRIILSFCNNINPEIRDSPGFNLLLEDINTNGTQILDSDIKYLVSQAHKRIFVKIPQKQAYNNPFLFHIFPVNKEDIAPNRAAIGSVFNNHDFTITKSKLIIPKPYSTQSDYTIIQCPLPSYPFLLIRLGQFDRLNGKHIWSFDYNGESKE